MQPQGRATRGTKALSRQDRHSVSLSKVPFILNGSISVVLPAYNEADCIQENLVELVTTLRRLGYDFEAIVVDDGSSDGTAELAAAIAANLSEVKIFRYEENRGKGQALRCGAALATGQYVVFLDSDLELHPRQLPVLLEILQREHGDVVVGCKNHPGSNVEGYPKLRRLASMSYYLIVKALFGLPIRDTQTGIKVYKKRVLEAVLPRVMVKRFAFDIEFLAIAHRLGYKIVEAPVTLKFARAAGRITWRDCANVFRETAAIFYRMSILKYYDRPIETLRVTAASPPVAAVQREPQPVD